MSLDRHAQITNNDHGPLVNIASWTLMVVSILFTSFRIISNVVLRGQVVKDDWAILVATTFAVAQSIASSLMVANGLGQHQNTLSNADILAYQRSLLASSILYVATLAFSKFSLLYFLSRLIAPSQKSFLWLMRASWAIMGLYLVAEALTIGFQCNVPATYNAFNGQCIDITAFWTFDAAFDIASSLAILALPIIIVHPLQMATSRKAQATLAFGFQIPTCAFAVVRLIYLRRAVNATDHTFAAVQWLIWTAVNMHLSVVAANMPCLKIFLEGFQSTLFRYDLNATQIETTRRSHGMSGRGSRPWVRDTSRNKSKGNESEGERDDKLRPDDGESSTAIVASSPPHHMDFEMPVDSEPGQDRGIKKMTEWTVLESSRA